MGYPHITRQGEEPCKYFGVKLGRVASSLAARHRAATEIRQLYQLTIGNCVT
jgi:hypothetical protein